MYELSDFITIVGFDEIATLATIIGTLAFVVSVITQVTKELWFLSKIPTSLQVIVLSIILTVFSYFAYVSAYQIEIQWYMIIGSVIIGFIVAFISMFGWEKLSSLYMRFKKDK